MTPRPGQTSFTVTFSEDTQFVGYLKARLYVEADGADDMDLFLEVQKLDDSGQPLIVAKLLPMPTQTSRSPERPDSYGYRYATLSPHYPPTTTPAAASPPP